MKYALIFTYQNAGKHPPKGVFTSLKTRLTRIRFSKIYIFKRFLCPENYVLF